MFTLLCIDDDLTALYIRRLVLERAGYFVLYAGDARTAVEIFTDTHVDLVLSDHFLQETTGMEMAAEMKRLKPNVPIAILSGAVDPPEGVLLHADLFLSKTETPQTVLQKIAELLNRG
jgi:CheY-like chemotaxis protein